MFRVYIETRSDFAVRDWLKAHRILTPEGKPIWSLGTLRALLTNRRMEDVPETAAYRTVRSAVEPIVKNEVFEMAQAIRRERSCEYPGSTGKSPTGRSTTGKSTIGKPANEKPTAGKPTE